MSTFTKIALICIACCVLLPGDLIAQQSSVFDGDAPSVNDGFMQSLLESIELMKKPALDVRNMIMGPIMIAIVIAGTMAAVGKSQGSDEVIRCIAKAVIVVACAVSSGFFVDAAEKGFDGAAEVGKAATGVDYRNLATSLKASVNNMFNPLANGLSEEQVAAAKKAQKKAEEAKEKSWLDTIGAMGGAAIQSFTQMEFLKDMLEEAAKAFVGFVAWVVGSIAAFLIEIAEVIRKLLLLMAAVLLPVFIAGLATEGFRSQGTNFIFGTLGIAAWPVAWTLGHIVTIGLYNWAINYTAAMAGVAVVGGAGTVVGAIVAPPLGVAIGIGALCIVLLSIIVLSIWIFLVTVSGPLIIAKCVTSGSQFASGLVGGTAQGTAGLIAQAALMGAMGTQVAASAGLDNLAKGAFGLGGGGGGPGDKPKKGPLSNPLPQMTPTGPPTGDKGGVGDSDAPPAKDSGGASPGSSEQTSSSGASGVTTTNAGGGGGGGGGGGNARPPGGGQSQRSGGLQAGAQQSAVSNTTRPPTGSTKAPATVSAPGSTQTADNQSKAKAEPTGTAKGGSQLPDMTPGADTGEPSSQNTGSTTNSSPTLPPDEGSDQPSPTSENVTSADAPTVGGNEGSTTAGPAGGPTTGSASTGGGVSQGTAPISAPATGAALGGGSGGGSGGSGTGKATASHPPSAPSPLPITPSSSAGTTAPSRSSSSPSQRSGLDMRVRQAAASAVTFLPKVGLQAMVAAARTTQKATQWSGDPTSFGSVVDAALDEKFLYDVGRSLKSEKPPQSEEQMTAMARTFAKEFAKEMKQTSAGDVS